MKLLAVAAAAVALAGSPGARYLESHQAPGGGFAEAGRPADPTTTAWATLALLAAGGSPAVEQARAYLASVESSRTSQTDLALNVLARAAAGERPDAALDRLASFRAGLVNATIWTILALRQAGRPAPPALVTALRAAQRPSGGWSWTRTGAADSNDTAAAIQALRSAGLIGRPIDRAVAYLRARQGRDGGFALSPGRASDAQSTAWAIQALLAAGRKPGAAAYRFLARMRRVDGSYRYSAVYATTPVWVTAQVLPALAGKPFPLRNA